MWVLLNSTQWVIAHVYWIRNGSSDHYQLGYTKYVANYLYIKQYKEQQKNKSVQCASSHPQIFKNWKMFQNVEMAKITSYEHISWKNYTTTSGCFSYLWQGRGKFIFDIVKWLFHWIVSHMELLFFLQIDNIAILVLIYIYNYMSMTIAPMAVVWYWAHGHWHELIMLNTHKCHLFFSIQQAWIWHYRIEYWS